MVSPTPPVDRKNDCLLLKLHATDKRPLQGHQLVEYRCDAHRPPCPFESSQTRNTTVVRCALRIPPSSRFSSDDRPRAQLNISPTRAFGEPFFRHMAKDLPPSSVRTLAQDAVQASVGATLSGVYKAIIRVLVTPKMLADHYQKIWSLYHTT